MFRIKTSMIFIATLVVMAFATIAYAFAWSNVASVDYAEEAISAGGYAVRNVIYTFSAKDPSVIVFVDFDIYPAASKAGVSLVTGATLTNCGVLTAGGHHAHCPVKVSAFDVDMLHVVAGD